MATRKQIERILDQWNRELEEDADTPGDIDITDPIDFDVMLHEYLGEYGLCENCKHYFSPERTCEKVSDSLVPCFNKIYKHWVERHPNWKEK